MPPIVTSSPVPTKNRVILRRNRRGNVTKIVREHYLRNDIHCGLEACVKCSGQCFRPKRLFSSSCKRIIILDKSVPIEQIDVLSHQVFDNVCIFGTVLDSTRQKSLALYGRLRNLIDDQARSFFVFPNEFHRETFVQRVASESKEEHSDRSVLEAVLWYQNHVKPFGVEVLLLTANQGELFQRASVLSDIKIQTLLEFADSVSDEAPELSDMLAATPEEPSDSMAQVIFDEYLPPSELNIGLKTGRFLQGKLSVSNHNLFEGSIFADIDGIQRSVCISGKKHINRAVHDDIVVVELLPRDQWISNTDNVIIDEEGDGENDNSNAELSERNDMQTDESDASITPMAKVVGIIRRNWRPFAGTIDTSRITELSNTVAASVWFYPVDRHIPRIRIRTRQLKKLIGRRLLVSIDSWSVSDQFPRGHYVKDLGPLGDKETELESLLHEHDVSYQPFTPEILSELPPEGGDWKVTETDFVSREDMRNLTICSIDPPGCTDIDDALHCRRIRDGVWECGVHIADVTHFVKSGTAMDFEASRRGTTVYLVNKRIDMLPPLLGTNLCSLRGGVERLAFSVVWELNDNAEILSTRYTKSVIKSSAALTYAEAQARIDDKNAKDDVSESIRNLNRLAKILKQRRNEAGSLTLSSPEVRFKLEHDSQDPVDVELKELKETNALVEEFMLLANISVAQIIWNRFPEVAVLRRHPSPNELNFDELRKSLKRFGFELKVDSSKALAESLDKADLANDSYFNTLVRILTTRCMMQAVYFCAGSIPESEFRHYGLASNIYTHFTSPIRRYSDVLVHRLLASCISSEYLLESSALFDRVKMTEICDNLNYRHRQAQLAGRSSVELFTHLYFRGKVVEEEGYVTRIMKNGASILVSKYGIEGFVYAKNAEGVEEFRFDPAEMCLRSDKLTLQIFSKVKVRITIDEGTIAGLRQKLRMELVK